LSSYFAAVEVGIAEVAALHVTVRGAFTRAFRIHHGGGVC